MSYRGALLSIPALRSARIARLFGVTVGGSAGADIVVTVALANSLFFGLPLAGARHQVALYLATVLLPLAVLTPGVSALLTRCLTRGGPVLTATAVVRCGVALGLLSTTGMVWYPLALALLLASRAHSIARTAVAADLVASTEGLLPLNTWISALVSGGAAAGAAAAAGATTLGGTPLALIMAAAMYAVTALITSRTPFGGATDVCRPRGEPPPVHGTTPTVSLAAAAVIRTTVGFLTLLLGLHLKDRPAALTAVTAAGVAGAAVGTGGAALLRGHLPPARVPSTMAGGLAVVLLLAATHPDLPLLAAVAGTAGFAWSTAKIALDGQLQQCGDYLTRRRVLSASACAFQLCWIVGAAAALLPVGLTGSCAGAGLATLLTICVAHGCADPIRLMRQMVQARRA